jgi:hypothetical protein
MIAPVRVRSKKVSDMPDRNREWPWILSAIGGPLLFPNILPAHPIIFEKPVW